MWRVLCTNYGPVKSTDTAASLLTQLEEFKKQDNERIGEYIARFDKIIMQLKLNNTVINDTTHGSSRPSFIVR